MPDTIKEENNFQGYYYTIPAKLIEIAPNHTAPILYGLIISLSSKEGYCWASNKFLAERLKISIRVLQRHLLWLEEHNFIERSINQRIGNQRKIYLKHIPITRTEKEEVEEKAVKLTLAKGTNNYAPNVTPHDEIVTPSCQISHNPSCRKRHTYSIKEESIKKNNKNIYVDTPNSTLRVSPVSRSLTDTFFNNILSFRNSFKKPDLNKWALEMDRMIRLDNRSVDEIDLLLKWLVNDHFWRKNILSTKKLRAQYDRLVITMESSENLSYINKYKRFVFKIKSNVPKAFYLQIKNNSVIDPKLSRELSFDLEYKNFCEVLASWFDVELENGDIEE